MVYSLEPDFKTQLGCPLLNLHSSDEYNQFDLHVCYLLSVLYMAILYMASSCHAVHSKAPFILIPYKTDLFFQIYIMIMSLL